jgi:hypothetical protein
VVASLQWPYIINDALLAVSSASLSHYLFFSLSPPLLRWRQQKKGKIRREQCGGSRGEAFVFIIILLFLYLLLFL